MNTYSFKRHPNARQNSPWRKSKNVIQTKQTLPTKAYSFEGTFNDKPATFIMVDERISGDTHLNERRRITGVVVQTYAGLQDSQLGKGLPTWHRETFKPDNIHLLFDYDGFHEGCHKNCECFT